MVGVVVSREGWELGEESPWRLDILFGDVVYLRRGERVGDERCVWIGFTIIVLYWLHSPPPPLGL